VVTLFSYGDECVLVVLEDGRDERRELARMPRHANGEGETCTPNSFSEGGGARRRPNVDQFPNRWMKPRPPGVVWPEESLDWLAFGELSSQPLAEGIDGA
jgi:hypothetical protein